MDVTAFLSVEYILKVEHDHPHRQIAVLIPELVVKHWWQAPLHNQRIIVINIPWYL
jgi:hypothetical protein